MKVSKIVSLILFCFLIFISCEEEPKDNLETSIENLKVHKAEKDILFNFAVPDSIPALLVAAVYYEHNMNAHGVIVYNDSNKREAYNYMFFADSIIQCDKILCVKFNEFKSATFNVQYIIKEKSVARIVQSSGLAYSSENMRIDNGNTYEDWIQQHTNKP